jgi:nicotinamidase-related amidase
VGLKFGRLGPSTVHLCVDMQRLFSAEGPWSVDWMPRVVPVVAAIAERHAERTVFTRFVPPRRAEDLPGRWRPYYTRWSDVTLERLDPRLVGLIPELAPFVPPAAVVDKHGYSAFTSPQLLPLLRERGVDTLVVSGSETDVCVLSTVLGAIDHGYRVTLVSDGICSSSDASHDRIVDFANERLGQQLEVADAETVLSNWG